MSSVSGLWAALSLITHPGASDQGGSLMVRKGAKTAVKQSESRIDYTKGEALIPSDRKVLEIRKMRLPRQPSLGIGSGVVGGSTELSVVHRILDTVKVQKFYYSFGRNALTKDWRAIGRDGLFLALLLGVLFHWTLGAWAQSSDPNQPTEGVVRIGVPAIEPFGSETGAALGQLLLSMLPQDLAEKVRFVPLSPMAVREGLRTGDLDAGFTALTWDSQGSSDLLAYVGSISFSIARLHYGIGDPAQLNIPEQIAFWGQQEDFAELLPNADPETFDPVLSYEEGAHKLLDYEATGLLGETYSMLWVFERFGLDFVDLESVADVQIGFWRNRGAKSPVLEALEDAFVQHPITTEYLDTVIQAYVAERSQQVMRFTTPLIPEINDGGEALWFNRLASELTVQMGMAPVITMQPFERSLFAVQNMHYDLLLGMIEVDRFQEVFPDLRYVGPPLFSVSYDIYYRDEAVLDRLAAGDPDLNILTESAHALLFDEEFTGISCIPCGVRMAATGRIDAFVFAGEQTDAILEEEGLDLLSSHYGTFPFRLVTHSENFEKLNSLLSSGVINLSSSGLSHGLLEEGQERFGFQFN